MKGPLVKDTAHRRGSLPHLLAVRLAKASADLLAACDVGHSPSGVEKAAILGRLVAMREALDLLEKGLRE